MKYLGYAFLALCAIVALGFLAFQFIWFLITAMFWVGLGVLLLLAIAAVVGFFSFWDWADKKSKKKAAASKTV